MNKIHTFLGYLTSAVLLGISGQASSQAQSNSNAISGVRAGPDILYAPAPYAPQLENTGVWKAAPILISGTSAYRSGEFLYQDFLYDDRGAGQRGLYPVELRSRTADNAADFVELRVKSLPAETAIRITFNAMLDQNVVGTTIALGEGTKAAVLPFGAGGTMPATIFITVHGSDAVITDAATGQVLPTKASVSVDPVRRQVEVRVPYTAFDPRGKSVRFAAGTGLWDSVANRYLAPSDPPAPPPPEPGAAPQPNRRPLAPLNPARSLFFNVAFRYHEPLNLNSQLPFFNDVQQASVLMSGDLSPFYATVDFVKLANGFNDDSAIPTKGNMSRIFASHFEPAQGRGSATNLSKACAEPCIPQFAGQLQPYGIYVPNKPLPIKGYGLTIDLHSADASYGRWLGQLRYEEFGERGTGSIVITPNGRGLRSGYWAESAADPFEAWADVERYYKIDRDYVALAGVSMGTGGSFKFAAQFPDLFSAMALHVNCPNFMMEAHRYIPVIMMTGDVDTLTNCHPGHPLLDRYVNLGQQLTWWNFIEHPHPFSSIPKSWKPFADFLGEKKRVIDPPRVTYYFNADMYEPKFGINSDHAYWLTNVSIRDSRYQGTIDPKLTPAQQAATPVYGKVDLFSYGLGQGDPIPNPKIKSTGSYNYNVPTYPWPKYNSEVVTWKPTAKTPQRDVLDVTAENIASITIDPRRAKLTCNAKVNVKSDGPVEVKLLGCTNIKVVMKQ